MKEFPPEAFVILIAIYILGRISLRRYLKKRILKAIKTNDLQALRSLEKEIGRTNALYWILPNTSDLFLSKIQKEICKIHRKNEEMIGINLDFLLRQAKDEYENLNGLTTSEDNDGEHT